ncbi:hypothetical protein NDU88_006296 [Pleurodeles waltl]|uniref:Uncharacterized protein n=1 Tax=Pleurodeles waltl TaxID=8319 RepID=A0AAV7NPT4_PLEWA|nr:hypothetical protein NDU88_006296 [Pleurodeles waltl]
MGDHGTGVPNLPAGITASSEDTDKSRHKLARARAFLLHLNLEEACQCRRAPTQRVYEYGEKNGKLYIVRLPR